VSEYLLQVFNELYRVGVIYAVTLEFTWPVYKGSWESSLGVYGVKSGVQDGSHNKRALFLCKGSAD
jgi:hypothetical protein